MAATNEIEQSPIPSSETLKDTLDRSEHEEKKPDKRAQQILDISRPCDFSFRQIDCLDFLEKLAPTEVDARQPRRYRVGALPIRDKENRYLSKSLWLNNNRLASLESLDKFVQAVLAFPSLLSWLDLSHNRIREIDEVITNFQNLKILYLHSNEIRSMRAIMRLRSLENLRNVTFSGNPIEESTQQYRVFIAHLLPKLVNLDFILITEEEKTFPPPAGFSKILE